MPETITCPTCRAEIELPADRLRNLRAAVREAMESETRRREAELTALEERLARDLEVVDGLRRSLAELRGRGDIEPPAAGGREESRFLAGRETNNGRGGPRRAGAAERVLRCLRGAGRPLARREVMAEAEVTVAEWTAAIESLVDAGAVVRIGAGSGARYRPSER